MERLTGTSECLVSVCLPVRNGVDRIGVVVKSVLAQDHKNLELIISDNASTDGTEELCRALAAADPRIRYHRQPRNMGLLNNFIKAMELARGTYLRWLGDDDWLEPNAIAACLEVFQRDPHLVLVTSRVHYIGPNGRSKISPNFEPGILASEDPAARFAQIIAFQISGMPVDPLYGLIRRASATGIARRNIIGEDHVFSSRLALAGPWGHVPEVLLHRHVQHDRLSVLAKRLDVPRWQTFFATGLQCLETFRGIDSVELTPAQRRMAYRAVASLYVGHHKAKMALRARKLIHLASKSAVLQTAVRHLKKAMRNS
jgi:glycosyltransferase involved in cell wall biosynthesis